MKISKMNDKECIDKFTEMLEERVSVTTSFLQNKESGILTHQILQIECGEEQRASQPQLLANPLRIADAEDLGETVN